MELCKTIGGLLGPILELKRDNERGLLRRASRAYNQYLLEQREALKLVRATRKRAR